MLALSPRAGDNVKNPVLWYSAAKHDDPAGTALPGSAIPAGYFFDGKGRYRLCAEGVALARDEVWSLCWCV